MIWENLFLLPATRKDRKTGSFTVKCNSSVKAHQAGSHKNKGWEVFTERVIPLIFEDKENEVWETHNI